MATKTTELTVPEVLKRAKDYIDYSARNYDANLAPHDHYTHAYYLLGKMGAVMHLRQYGFDLICNHKYENVDVRCTLDQEITDYPQLLSYKPTTADIKHAKQEVHYLSTHFGFDEALNIHHKPYPELLSGTDMQNIYHAFKSAVQHAQYKITPRMLKKCTMYLDQYDPKA